MLLISPLTVRLTLCPAQLLSGTGVSSNAATLFQALVNNVVIDYINVLASGRYPHLFTILRGTQDSKTSWEPKNPARLKAFIDWPALITHKGLQRFLGFATFYRRLIRKYSSFAIPLIFMTSVKIPFFQSEKAARAFRELKV